MLSTSVTDVELENLLMSIDHPFHLTLVENKTLSVCVRKETTQMKLRHVVRTLQLPVLLNCQPCS